MVTVPFLLAVQTMNPPTFSLEGVTSIQAPPVSSGPVASAEAEVGTASTPASLLKAVSALVRAKRASEGFVRAEALMGKTMESLSRLQTLYERDVTDTRQLNTLIQFETTMIGKLLPILLGPIGMEQVRRVFRVEDSCGTSANRPLIQLFKDSACKTLAKSAPYKLKMPCWICGFPIQSGRTGTGGFSLSCDHVLPESQAQFFVDVANAGDVSLTKACYGYAHRMCNEMKQGSRLIRVGTGKQFEIVPDAHIKAMLRDLYEHGDSKFPGEAKSLKDLVGPNFTKWATSRLSDVKARIQACLQGMDVCAPDTVTLASLITCKPSGSSRRSHTRRRKTRGGKTRRRF